MPRLCLPKCVRWALGIVLTVAILGVPFGYYRASYVQTKRLRVVTDGKLYRCGQLPAAGFREAFQRYSIKCVVNLQEEARDPHIPQTWFDSWRGEKHILESDLCRTHGVKYITLDGGILDHPEQAPGTRPRVIDEFLEVLDDPTNYPILIHCKAGLHRTGLMTALYRMEMEHRTKAEAVRELRANGFGTFGATDSNAYLVQFIDQFEPGIRRGVKQANATRPPGKP